MQTPCGVAGSAGVRSTDSYQESDGISKQSPKTRAGRIFARLELIRIKKIPP
jgi:hypothetical protein